MNLEDFLVQPPRTNCEKWQLGTMVLDEIVEGAIVLIFVSDFRGANAGADFRSYSVLRKNLFQLSKLDFELPIVDLGNLISGKTLADTHLVIQELVTVCLAQHAIPVIIGGSTDLSLPLFSAVNAFKKNTNFIQMSNKVSLSNEGRVVTEANYLSKLLGGKDFDIKNFRVLGYQKHLNEIDSIKLIEEVGFDVVRLSDMMGSTEATEPYLRQADLVTFNCDAAESFDGDFSIHPQVNGLNRRELCAYMKEIGLSEQLLGVGVFNFNALSENLLHHQLMAQMLWYLIEGINIQKSHPKDRDYDTFIVMIDDKDFTFKRDTFSGLWYFGDDEEIGNCVPCSKADYEQAKQGNLNHRFLK